MSSQNKRWIVRDVSGHIYGPFEPAKIGELLKKGVLSGDESTSEYPVGDWVPMSSIKELYDIVLESMNPRRENEQEPKRELPNVEKIQTHKQEPPHHNANSPAPPKSTPPDIELKEKKHLKSKKKDLIPVILVLAAMILTYFALNKKTFVRKFRTLNLLSPHIKPTRDQAKSKTQLNLGWNYFYKDTYNNYFQAQEAFVRAVEEDSRNPEPIIMLLMTDLELWPFAKQDSNDQNVLQNLLQLISKADFYGGRRSLATAVVDMMLRHDSNAQSQIESSLSADPNEGRLYALKAQILFDSANFPQSISYFEKSAALIPYWAKPIYMMGLGYSKQGNPTLAQQYFIQALKMNPGHTHARLELGVLEGLSFMHDDKAKEYLTLALDSQELLMPSIESRGHYVLAVILNREGQAGRAKDQAEMALKLNPTDPDIRDLLKRLGSPAAGTENTGDDRQHMVLGDQYMRLGNYLGAQAQYKTAFSVNPQNGRAALSAAQALWKLHQSHEAMEFLQKAMAADPKLIDSYIVMASFKSQHFEFEEASRLLESALKINPRNHEIYREYAELFLKKGESKSAESYVGRALQLYEPDVLSNQVMARVMLLQKNLPKAIQYSKRSIELDKTNAEAQIEYAKILAQFEGVKSAEEYLRDLINTYPSQLSYRVGLAEIFKNDEQYKMAIQVLSQVMAIDDRNKDAFLISGDAKYSVDDLDGALNDYLSAARIDPSDALGIFRAGEIYLKGNRTDDALKEFQLVLRVNPLFPRAHYSLAKVYSHQGMGDLAIKELDEEKKLNPKLADPYEFAGDLYLTSRKFSLATKEYQKASELKPQGASIFVKLSRAYRGQGSHDSALAMLRLAQQKESGYPEIYREQGSLFEAKGMYDEAILSYQQYLRLVPNPPDKDSILSKIKELQQ